VPGSRSPARPRRVGYLPPQRAAHVTGSTGRLGGWAWLSCGGLAWPGAGAAVVPCLCIVLAIEWDHVIAAWVPLLAADRHPPGRAQSAQLRASPRRAPSVPIVNDNRFVLSVSHALDHEHDVARHKSSHNACSARHGPICRPARTGAITAALCAACRPAKLLIWVSGAAGRAASRPPRGPPGSLPAAAVVSDR
jgi:hypothetical protein